MAYRFGVRVKGEEGDLKISIDNFIGRRNGSYCYKDSFSKELFESNPDTLEKALEEAKRNYRLNMLYYESLSSDDFNFCIDSFKQQHRTFSQVEDLNDFNFPGVYILVLDRYKQVYVGVTKGKIKERIMQHWSKRFPLDRMLFGDLYSSRLPIDCFKAFDTTRIFAEQTQDLSSLEKKIVSEFPDCYLCNRTAGGLYEGGLGEAIVNRLRGRDLKRFESLLAD